MIDKSAPFPQANDFDKVVTVLNTDEFKLSNSNIMATVLGDLTGRQVDYYIAACRYLGLVNGDKLFTEEGHALRRLIGAAQNAALARLVISDEVFGAVYFRWKMFGIEPSRADIIAIMKVHVSFASEEMYIRRASTVLSWVRWIRNHESVEN